MMKFNGRNLYISPNAIIGSNVKIGDNTVIYDNVIIEENTIICNDCVIGEPVSEYYNFDPTFQNLKTVIGKNSLIRSHSIIYSGSSFGESFSTGHRVIIREKSIFGSHCRVGTLSDIQGNVTFGDYCWLHSNVHVGQKTTIQNFVFLYPYVVLTNDPYPPSNVCIGPTIGDFSQIAVGSIIMPGINIGKHCLIGANSMVNKNVLDFQLVVGNPAKFIKDTRDLVSKKTGVKHYPWPNNFNRGMPWQDRGFNEWFQTSKYNIND